MADEMSAKQIPLTIIVAATAQNGIGKNNALPWPLLKKEMAYFARVTKRVPPPNHTARRNAVIMGRKTWESIPARLRPLKDRTNVVISSQSREALGGDDDDDVVVAGDLVAGLEALVRRQGTTTLGRAFVIGGARVYERALELEQTKRVLLTRIRGGYECDTFFPGDLGSGWRRGSLGELREFVGEEVPEEAVREIVAGGEEVEFEYQLYERD